MHTETRGMPTDDAHGDRSLILVINCGSSSLKFALFDMADRHPLISGLAERLGQDEASLTCRSDIWRDQGGKMTLPLGGEGAGGDHAAALDALLGILAERGWADQVGAVGHRVVHGGERFKASVRVTAEVLADIEALIPLAPLHNPANLLGIRTAIAKMPGTPQVAVFDTAFHQSMPPAAYHYAIPMRFYREHGVRRYGFHGTSVRYVTEEATERLGLDPADHGMVVAHLGNGASATAVVNGAGVDTSMGLTPLEGLVMGTRSGDIDPGAMLHIARMTGYGVDAMDKLLNKESGLLGLSELSNDCRALEAAAAEGHAGACLALEVFAHRLARAIGGLAMSLPRLDALVFTGGIGENSAHLRALTMRRLRPLGFALDDEANHRAVRGLSGVISRATERPIAMVINTNEEWLIARDSAELALGLCFRDDRVTPDECVSA